jgi:uncharacterized Ntn-hydrolase superfamily protein
MTWSILTHDPATGAFGLAVSTCNFAVGAGVAFLRAGIGVCASQSFSNRYLGPPTLDALARGLSPRRAIDSVIAGDEGRGLRQIHTLDRRGDSAAWTGENCVDFCGSAAAPGVSVAGNMLAGPAVIDHTLATYINTEGRLAERMLAAMDAGQAAGGDRRGRQSAALFVITTEDHPDLNIRVDDHTDPLVELRRLLAIWQRDREPGLAHAPRRANPAGQTDLDAIDAGFIAAGSPLRTRR